MAVFEIGGTGDLRPRFGLSARLTRGSSCRSKRLSISWVCSFCSSALGPKVRLSPSRAGRWRIVGSCRCGRPVSLVQGQVLFLAGRYLRERAWVRRVTAKPAYGRVAHGLARHPIKLALSFRFLFGLRSLTPLVLGTSGVPAIRFAVLNVVGALIWATVFVGLGYVFGTGIERLFGRLPVHIHLTAVVACVVVLLVGIWLWRRHKRRRWVEVI